MIQSFWLKQLVCCDNSNPIFNFGAFDYDDTPRKIVCTNCELETDYHLSPNGMLDDWSRQTGQDITAILEEAVRNRVSIQEDGTKFCTGCEQYLEPFDFRSVDGYPVALCIDCNAKRQRKYREDKR